MASPLYAVVAYVRNPVGQFIEDLRHELYPEHSHLGAHITVLPPRPLLGTEEQALALLESVCATTDPFEVGLGEVETFVPITPTVFIHVVHAAYRMRELHDRLNVAPLGSSEQWPYMPHLTIVKMDSVDDAQTALQDTRERWKAYRDTRRILVDQLTFVREDAFNRWVDLAPVPLGRHLVSKL